MKAGTDKNSYRPSLSLLAKALDALSHPARLAIIEVLAHRGSCICEEIIEELPSAQSSVAQHLAVLKKSGLIQGEIEGIRTCYCLDIKRLVILRQTLDKFFDSFPIMDTDKCC